MLSKNIKLHLAKNFPELNFNVMAKTQEIEIDILNADRSLEILRFMQSEPTLLAQQLLDLTAIDYLHYGVSEAVLTTSDPEYMIKPSFARAKFANLLGVNGICRFSLVYQLLSMNNNLRIRLQFLLPDHIVTVASCTKLWSIAASYEREIFDLFGINFIDHPNLSRIFNATNFVGHPFRKDFAVEPSIETRFDGRQGEIIQTAIISPTTPKIPKVVAREGEKELG